MKKSEMKKILFDTLLNKCYLGVCLNDTLDDRDCDLILDILLENGMLPPTIKGMWDNTGEWESEE